MAFNFVGQPNPRNPQKLMPQKQDIVGDQTNDQWVTRWSVCKLNTTPSVLLYNSINNGELGKNDNILHFYEMI